MAGREGRDRVKESFRCRWAGLGLFLRAVQRVEKDTVSQIYIDRGWRESAGLGYSFASWAASEDCQAQESSKP